MTDIAGLVLAARTRRAGGPGRIGAWRLAIPALVRDAFEREAEERRLFLWLPVMLGTGIVLYFAADREPSLVLTAGLSLAFAALAAIARRHRAAVLCFVAVAAVFAGMAVAGWRAMRLAASVLERVRIATVQGYVEEMDFRREGARFVLRVAASDDLDTDKMPYRVRLTTRRTPDVEAGAYVEVKARLLPPSRAAEPDGYDFARDAWFHRIGAVGSVLGRIETADAPEPPDLMLRLGMAVDRARNALARRVDAIVGGDSGAIAAAMVTGKRDRLSEDAKATIREAGIFHVITIAGVQMTLVAGIFFVGLRRLLALSPTLTLHYPIKKWAAAAAIVAALGYDVMTGSRVGTERALVMTLVMLVAVLLDRQALTMRNLALAALVVLLLEPEEVLGASFQLSFAAVGALVAVHEARTARAMREAEAGVGLPRGPAKRPAWLPQRPGHGFGHAVVSTFCATSATAAFMACDFHEMNPYVVVGNPLTLAIIEIFAVPGAILGTLLYPLGLDAPVWHYVGWGIAIVMGAARFVGGLPGATVHLPSFAPWSLAFFALAVLGAILWRTLVMRLTAVPLVLLGLAGALSGPTFDVVVAPLGDAVAVRGADGRLAVIGRRPSAFAAEQWLRADADGRVPATAVNKTLCDALGCVAHLRDGRAVALVLEPAAFAEDCLRAAIVVTPLFAPKGCAAPILVDRGTLRRTGAISFREGADGGFVARAARKVDEDRPWSPAVRPMWSYDPTRGDSGRDNPGRDDLRRRDAPAEEAPDATLSSDGSG